MINKEHMFRKKFTCTELVGGGRVLIPAWLKSLKDQYFQNSQIFPDHGVILPFPDSNIYENKPSISKSEEYSEWIKNKPLHNVSLWYMDYFELKAIKTMWAQEKFLLLP